MELVLHLETKEFTYESREERSKHVELMNKDGWEESGKIRRLKDGFSIWDATPEKYEWFAQFHRYGDVKQ